MRVWLVLAALNGFLAVAIGAFAAHGLKVRVTADRLALIDTAARYQMYHALALIGVAWVAERHPGSAATLAGSAFLIGIVIFCGALYALGLSGSRGFGLLAPVGGIAFLIGWIALGWAALNA